MTRRKNSDIKQRGTKQKKQRAGAPPAVYNKAEALAFCEQWLLAGKAGGSFPLAYKERYPGSTKRQGDAILKQVRETLGLLRGVKDQEGDAWKKSRRQSSNWHKPRRPPAPKRGHVRFRPKEILKRKKAEAAKRDATMLDQGETLALQ